MDETTAGLCERLERRLRDACGDRIEELIREAEDEAFREARAIIKDTMLRAILQRVVDRADGGQPQELGPIPLTSSPNDERRFAFPDKEGGEGYPSLIRGGARGEVLPESACAPNDQDALRREIEALRARIAGNEQEIATIQSAGAPRQAAEPEQPTEPAETGAGICIYAVVDCPEGQSLPALPAAGLDPAFPVYAIPFRSHLAVVSLVSLTEFGQAQLDENLKDLKWLETKVLAHQAVLDCLVTEHNFIPMRFCTIYRSQESLLDMLAQYHDVFADTLGRLRGKQEWGVKAYCHQETLAGWVRDSNPAIRERKAELDQKSGGAVYFLKKKLDDQIENEVVGMSDETAQRSHDRLCQMAIGSSVNPLQSSEDGDKGTPMILNAAYLVPREQWPTFRAEVENLQREFDQLGCRYEMTGPWPPYNFAAVELEGCRL